MKTIKFMAEIEWVAPDGFDVRKIIAFRAPKAGEKFLSSPGEVKVSGCDWDHDNPRPIIDDWEFPEWLSGAAAVVMLPDGDWTATERVPEPSCAAYNGWRNTGNVCLLRLTAFVPPACASWRESLRINPKLQAGGG